MLKAINTKILLAILVALAAIGGALTYQRHEAAKAADAAAKTAAILQQQQKETEECKAQDEAFRQCVEADKKKYNSAAANEGKTWQKYIGYCTRKPEIDCGKKCRFPDTVRTSKAGHALRKTETDIRL